METPNTGLGSCSIVNTYRALPDDRIEEFREITSDAFAPQHGPGVPDPSGRPELGGHRGVFQGDDLVAVCQQYYLPARVRGEWHDAGLLSAVATPPEHRRRGYARTLLTGSLDEYHDRGVTISLLWPFDYGFYGRYGWGRTNEYVTVEVPVEELPVDVDRSLGSFEGIEPDEGPRLDPAYQTHAERYALSIDRTADWWERQILWSHEYTPYTYAYVRDGEVRGYVVYRIEQTGDSRDDRTLTVREIAWDHFEVYRRLLAFVRDHDAQVTTVRLQLPVDTPVFDLVSDPTTIEYRVHPGPMARIVDVVTALDGLPSNEAAGTITLRVEDSLADWNDETFTVDATGGLVSCTTDSDDATANTSDSDDATANTSDSDDATRERSDATVDIRTLSRLYVGSITATEARSLGLLDGSATAVQFLDTLFPEQSVYLRDPF